MEQSPEINDLAAALAKFQGELEAAPKDGKNSVFNNDGKARRYSTLESVWKVCREPLTSNGLSVVQTFDSSTDGVVINTQLNHLSGQWMRGSLFMRAVKSDKVETPSNNPHNIGKLITYGRRFGMVSMLGIIQEDDDGNAASGKGDKKAPAKPKPDPTQKARADITAKLSAAEEKQPGVVNDAKIKLEYVDSDGQPLPVSGMSPASMGNVLAEAEKMIKEVK